MKLYELSQLPFKERFKFVSDLTESEMELLPDAKIVFDIFNDTIAWFKKSSAQYDPNVLSKLKDANEDLPSFFQSIYNILEKFVIEKLPPTERERVFNESKERWGELYPNFGRIEKLMEHFKTNELLAEYGKNSPPLFMRYTAIEIYKKCVSFKIKFSKKIASHLSQNPNTYHIHYYNARIYCIKEDKVKDFLKDYQEWNLKMHNLWNAIWSLKDHYYSYAAYEKWKFYIEYPDSLKQKADETQKMQDDALSLLNAGKELLLKHDEAITLEYQTNAFDMSVFERESEIALIYDSDFASDEEYCYVYTLECELFVFYVGIAASPKERFEQHIRGAFSDEAHLFKSKFIQKYHKEVKQSIVYEGTRRECKDFERQYISKHNPLGNMTEGGEG